VKALVALELLAGEDPLENAGVPDAVSLHPETGEPVLRVTTGSAPRLLRVLSGEGSPQIRALAGGLQGVRRAAYGLHAAFYEGASTVRATRARTSLGATWKPLSPA